MSNNQFAKAVSQKKQIKSATERLEALEKYFEQQNQELTKTLTELSNSLLAQREVLNAVIKVLGTETVDAAIKEERDLAAQREADRIKQNLADAVTRGDFAKVDAVTDNCLIVAHEVAADGTTIPPGRVHLFMSQVKPEFKEKLMGQTAGFSLATPDGSQFVVDEVYVPVAKQPEATTAPTVDAAAVPVDASVDTQAVAVQE